MIPTLLPVVGTPGSKRIGTYAQRTDLESLRNSLEIIVTEHYPVEDRDDMIVSLAKSLGLSREVRFHSSLEDPLFREFGSERYAEVLKALSKGSTGPMTGDSISKAVRAAQKKVKKKAFGDQHVSSPEEWFTYNIRRGVAHRPAR